MIASVISIPELQPLKVQEETLKIQEQTLYISKTSTDIVVVVVKFQTAPWVKIAAISVRGQTTGYSWDIELSDFEDKYKIFTGEITLKNKR